MGKARDEKDNDELNLNIDDSDKKQGAGFFSGIREKLSRKILIIIGCVVFAVAAAVFLLIFIKGKEEATIAEETVSKVGKEMTRESGFVMFDDIVQLNVVEIKLGDLGGEKVFTVGLYCKIDRQELREELLSKDAEVAELISAILKSKTYAELQDVDGKILIRNEIIKHLNEHLQAGRIINLFFYEYLIL